MRILIVGGAGFLGCNLVRYCLAKPGHPVAVLDFLDPHLHATTDHLKPIWNQIEFLKGDLRDEALLAEAVRDREVIFNCAGQTSHPLSIRHPVLDADVNCLGNLKLLEAVRLHNRDALLAYVSSSTVIGKARRDPVDEDHPEHPLDIYSADKGVAEKYYRIYHSLHGLNTVVLRFANLYGPYGKGHPDFGFINYFIHQAWLNREITIYGTGAQTRNLLFVDDACEVLWRAAREPRLRGGLYFATGEEHLSVRDIAVTIVKVLGRGTVKHVDWPEERKRIEIGNVRFSSARLQGILGWRPRYNLETGLERTRAILEEESAQP